MRGPDRAPSGPWAVVVLGFLALGLAFSARALLGLVMPAWETELGWSRGFVSASGGLALLVIAGFAPVAGWLLDRYGPRLLLSLGLGMVGLGMALLGAAQAAWHLPVAFGGIAAVGFGIVSAPVIATAVTRRFPERPGLPTGIATAGATGGQIVIVPLVGWALAGIGWRPTFWLLAAACLLTVPVAARLLQGGERGLGPRAADRPDPRGPDLAGLVRNPVFLALFGSFLICGFTTAGAIEVHFMPFAAACGFPPVTAAGAYGLLSAVNLGSMVLAGWMTDRVHRPTLLAGIYFGRAAVFLLPPLVGADPSLLLLFAALFGIVDYATVPVTAGLVAAHIGRRGMGFAMGLIASGHAIGAAAGAFAGGLIFDLTARYDGLWAAGAVTAALAGLLVLTIREIPRPAAAQPA